jgi:hypothetical protein
MVGALRPRTAGIHDAIVDDRAGPSLISESTAEVSVARGTCLLAQPQRASACRVVMTIRHHACRRRLRGRRVRTGGRSAGGPGVARTPHLTPRALRATCHRANRRQPAGKPAANSQARTFRGATAELASACAHASPRCRGVSQPPRPASSRLPRSRGHCLLPPLPPHTPTPPTPSSALPLPPPCYALPCAGHPRRRGGGGAPRPPPRAQRGAWLATRGPLSKTAGARRGALLGRSVGGPHAAVAAAAAPRQGSPGPTAAALGVGGAARGADLRQGAGPAAESVASRATPGGSLPATRAPGWPGWLHPLPPPMTHGRQWRRRLAGPVTARQTPSCTACQA